MPFTIAQSIIALFIRWGKNQVCLRVLASKNNVFDSSDMGINETQAIRVLKAIVPQKIILPWPEGLGIGVGIGFDNDLKYGS